MAQPPAPKVPAPIDPNKIDVRASLDVIERVMENAFDPKQAVTPGELQDLCQMYVSDMHLRKVTPEYWLEKQQLPFRLHALASQILAESSLQKVVVKDGPEFKTLDGSIQLSLKEINDLRRKILAELALLKQCPLPGVQLH